MPNSDTSPSVPRSSTGWTPTLPTPTSPTQPDWERGVTNHSYGESDLVPSVLSAPAPHVYVEAVQNNFGAHFIATVDMDGDHKPDLMATDAGDAVIIKKSDQELRLTGAQAEAFRSAMLAFSEAKIPDSKSYESIVAVLENPSSQNIETVASIAGANPKKR